MAIIDQTKNPKVATMLVKKINQEDIKNAIEKIDKNYSILKVQYVEGPDTIVVYLEFKCEKHAMIVQELSEDMVKKEEMVAAMKKIQ